MPSRTLRLPARLPLPLDPAVAEAMQAGLPPPSHDPKRSETVLQMVAQGLRLVLRQSRDRPPAARDVALLTALTGMTLPDGPQPEPAFAQAMRTVCYLHVMDAPDAWRQTVLVTARVVP